jgi:GntR family transcriptional repressor for pyruvate dehydrogenase complex
MPFKPVEKILVSDGILEQIRDLIHSGEFLPGQRLPSEVKMAALLSVSRSSLREALNALVHLGYLQRQTRGIYVNPSVNWRATPSFRFSRSQEDLDVAEMIEVRKIVESELCALAAKRAEPEDIKALEQNLDQMEARLNDPKAFINSNQRFHLSIARAAKNHILEDFTVNIRNLLKSNIALVIEKSAISRRSLGYHRRIFEAIRDGDVSRARRAMAEHVADIEKEFVKILYQGQPSFKTGELKSRKTEKNEEHRNSKTPFKPSEKGGESSAKSSFHRVT